MSPLGGMVVMYLLMSAFHSTHWLKLVSRRHHAGRRQLVGTRRPGAIRKRGAEAHQRPILLTEEARR